MSWRGPFFVARVCEGAVTSPGRQLVWLRVERVYQREAARQTASSFPLGAFITEAKGMETRLLAGWTLFFEYGGEVRRPKDSGCREVIV